MASKEHLTISRRGSLWMERNLFSLSKLGGASDRGSSVIEEHSGSNSDDDESEDLTWKILLAPKVEPEREDIATLESPQSEADSGKKSPKEERSVSGSKILSLRKGRLPAEDSSSESAVPSPKKLSLRGLQLREARSDRDSASKKIDSPKSPRLRLFKSSPSVMPPILSDSPDSAPSVVAEAHSPKIPQKFPEKKSRILPNNFICILCQCQWFNHSLVNQSKCECGHLKSDHRIIEKSPIVSPRIHHLAQKSPRDSKAETALVLQNKVSELRNEFSALDSLFNVLKIDDFKTQIREQLKTCARLLRESKDLARGTGSDFKLARNLTLVEEFLRESILPLTKSYLNQSYGDCDRDGVFLELSLHLEQLTIA